MNGIKPSEPGYSFSSADISDPSASNSALANEISNRIIMQSGIVQRVQNAEPVIPHDDPISPTAAAMLALLLKNTPVQAVKYNTYPFFLPSNGTPYTQQILPANPNRKFLYINGDGFQAQYNTEGFYILIQETGPTAQAVSDLTTLSNRGIYLASNAISGLTFAPFSAPTDAISILCISSGNPNTGVRGVILEGV